MLLRSHVTERNGTFGNCLPTSTEFSDCKNNLFLLKERRGSLGIPLHHHQQHLQQICTDLDTSREERRGSNDSTPQMTSGRRASLTPNMLDFNSLMKHQP
jgi:hypothetical protein